MKSPSRVCHLMISSPSRAEFLHDKSPAPEQPLCGLRLAEHFTRPVKNQPFLNLNASRCSVLSELETTRICNPPLLSEPCLPRASVSLCRRKTWLFTRILFLLLRLPTRLIPWLFGAGLEFEKGECICDECFVLLLWSLVISKGTPVYFQSLSACKM